jgi:DNA invertase Pin-like site-specific DNA recombinase
MGATIAYCRVSSRDQNPELQLDALDTNGYDRLFAEKESGKRGVERPEFTAALSALQAGDTLVFWKSDRWGRSAAHVLTTIGELRGRGVTVKSLTENFDLDTKEGRFIFAVLAAAEYELELRAERQAKGIAAARRRQAEGRMLPGKKAHRPAPRRRPGRAASAAADDQRGHHRHPGRPHPENLPLHCLRRARQHTLTCNQPQARITKAELPQVRDTP